MKKTPLLTTLAAALCLVMSAPAQADEPRTHDGFHFLFGIGPAYQRTAFAGIQSDAVNGERAADGSYTGWGVSGAILFGGSIRPGLAIGGGMMGFHAVKPSVTVLELDLGNGDTDLVGSIVGPYVDWYPDPSGGLHVLGQFGFATLKLPTEEPEIATGFGATLGVGYDFFVADQVSLGVLGRVQLASTKNDIWPFEGRGTTLVPAINLTMAVH